MPGKGARSGLSGPSHRTSSQCPSHAPTTMASQFGEAFVRDFPGFVEGAIFGAIRLSDPNERALIGGAGLGGTTACSFVGAGARMMGIIRGALSMWFHNRTERMASAVAPTPSTSTVTPSRKSFNTSRLLTIVSTMANCLMVSGGSLTARTNLGRHFYICNGCDVRVHDI